MVLVYDTQLITALCEISSFLILFSIRVQHKIHHLSLLLSLCGNYSVKYNQSDEIKMWTLKKKKTDQFLPVVLFNMLNNVVLTLRFRLCMKSKSVTIQMKVY